MSLRYSRLADMPADMRKLVQDARELKGVLPEAAQELRRQILQEERERHQLAMLKQLEAKNLGVLFEREYVFHDERKWRLDLYARGYRLGIELHGGISEHKRGRHLRAGGFMRDREKMNAAVECGIRVLEYWPAAIADGSACEQVERIIGGMK